MAIIKMDDESLRNDSNNLKNKIEDFQKLSQKLDDLIDEIASKWVGKASISYLQKMKEQQGKITKIQGVTQEYKNYVDEALNEMTSLDNALAQKIRNSF